jgi:CheY-like chemotaxis protein
MPNRVREFSKISQVPSPMTTILIADDHADIRRLLSITLGKEFAILEAEDGISALNAIRQHRPTAVLLDVMMPGEMNGLQVLEAVKADPATRDILVAMVTARGQGADADDARKRGADAYFIKPFSPLKVVAWLRSNLP